MLFDCFDRIRIINLARRADRREEMRQELRKLGLEANSKIAFFEARSFGEPGDFPTAGLRGAFHSHMDVLTEAAAAGESVLIFEDDVDFTPHIQSYEMPRDWGIFYGGHMAADPSDLQNSDIVGAHFMGFSAEAARRISEYLRHSLELPAHQACRYIDGTYVWFRRANPDIPTVFADPVLGYQRPSRTDCSEGNFFDRLPILGQAAALARKAKRFVQHRQRA